MSLDNAGYTHSYATSGKYFVSITGALDAINFFEIEYQDGINTVSPLHLNSLEDFRLPLCQYTSDKIDFSANVNLKNIDLAGIRGNLRDIDISNNLSLLSIDLQGNNFPAAVMDKMIDNLYTSCVRTGRKNGFLNIGTVVFDNPYNPSSRDLIGPPSPSRVAKLNKLLKDYGWFVFPISTMPSSETPALGRVAGDKREHLTGKALMLQRYLEHMNN